MSNWFNAYALAIYDETHSSSDADLRADTNIVIEVRDTSDALSTLYTTRHGSTSLSNPFLMSDATDGNTKLARFYSDDAEVNIAAFDYGNAAATTDHAQYFGRYGRLLNVKPTGKKYMTMSSQDALRIVRVPFLATGTDANDTPVNFDTDTGGVEEPCVILNGSSIGIIFPAGFHIEDVVVEIETSDASATFSLGFKNTTESGDADGLLDAAVCDGTEPYQILSTSTRGVLLQVSDGVDTGGYTTDGTIKTLVCEGSSGIDTFRGNAYIMGYILPQLIKSN